LDKDKLKELIFRYEVASFSVTKKTNALIREQVRENITVDQFQTLRYIHNHGPCTTSELADVFGVYKGAITAIINRLVDRELVKRVQDQKDRRVICLSVTEEGAKLYQSAQGPIHQQVAEFLTEFSATEIEDFVTSYEKLNKAIQLNQINRLDSTY